MTKFKVTRLACGLIENLSPYTCCMCHMEFTQLYWYDCDSRWFHSEECAEMHILREMGE